MKNSISFLYTQNSLQFFSTITRIKDDIKQYQKQPEYLEIYDNISCVEISRGKSYAFWDDLKRLVDQGQKLGIDTFKDSLRNHGITDENFQTKIVIMILQNKLGLQFGLNKVLEVIIHEFQGILNPDQFIWCKNGQVSLKIVNNNQLILSYKTTLTETDLDTDLKMELGHFDYSIMITPEKVTIMDFTFTNTSNHETANQFYDFLESHQHHFIIRILIWIKRFFGFDEELCLEESSNPQHPSLAM